MTRTSIMEYSRKNTMDLISFTRTLLVLILIFVPGLTGDIFYAGDEEHLELGRLRRAADRGSSPMSARVRNELKQEILNILGLQHQPKPGSLRGGRNHSAPIFMMELYRTLSADAESDRHDSRPEAESFPMNAIYNSPDAPGLGRIMSGTVFNYTRNEVQAVSQADTIMSLPGKHSQSTTLTIPKSLQTKIDESR